MRSRPATGRVPALLELRRRGLGNTTAHLGASIAWWIHATVPTLDYVAAIGDQSRASQSAIYDYRRELKLEAGNISNDATAQANASWSLHSISVQ
ncbi:MAG: hypothetical protein ABIQ70_05060 [Dokdonella sp.]